MTSFTSSPISIYLSSSSSFSLSTFLPLGLLPYPVLDSFQPEHRIGERRRCLPCSWQSIQFLPKPPCLLGCPLSGHENMDTYANLPYLLQTAVVTYMSIPAIAHEVNDLRKDSDESAIYGIWDVILNWTFPVTAGYITRPQVSHSFHDGKRGYSDFHTFELGVQPWKLFLITQCKAYKLQSYESVWDNGYFQLREYIRSQHPDRTATSPIYEILAVGQRVSFFLFNPVTQHLRAWRPSAQWALAHHTAHGKRRIS
ncbi:hypothetical protein DTO217A2_573 [Paecilomyces variotii]|nr:hypothetical protein DTO217A2_573 [Paecilomyces variotii]